MKNCRHERDHQQERGEREGHDSDEDGEQPAQCLEPVPSAYAGIASKLTATKPVIACPSRRAPRIPR